MRIFTAFICSFFYLTGIAGQTPDSSLTITHLTDNFYIYTTYNLYNGVKVPANGMYLVTRAGIVLFDTPWDSTRFQPLLDSIRLKHNKKVLLCIATHFHGDRTAGLEFYKQQGIKTFTTKETDNLSQKRGMKRAEFLMTKDTVFTVGQYSFQTYYPGPGHTSDNIVIWFNREKILYGGCLIKSADADDLGFLGDANPGEYASTMEKIQRKFKHPVYIIPGHGDWTDIHSLEHTLNLARQLK